MPFTAIHPIIVLPIASSRRFSTTALIAGSIIPDFEFFFQLREVENIGHTWYGILLFDLPAGLLLCYLFHGLIKKPLTKNLPYYFRSRIISHMDLDWGKHVARFSGRVILSLLAGVLTHIIWDGFTHSDGLFTGWLPFLNNELTIKGFVLPVYYWLQLSFSLAGLPLLAYYVHKQPASIVIRDNGPQSRYWLILGLGTVFIFTLRVLLLPQHNGFWSLIMALIGSFCYSLLAVSLLYRFNKLKDLKHEYR